MLNNDQRARLAREARILAMECAEGTAPKMITFSRDDGDGHHCALGWLEVRSGFGHVFFPDERGVLDAAWLVADANNEAADHEDRLSRLQFPLLALADALEET